MSSSFEGKLVIVTGGSRGIGQGIVKAFAAAGGRVALVASSPERGEAAAADLALGEQVQGFGCDIADGEAVAALVTRIREEMGEVNFLVNNAGLTEDNLFARMKTEQWQRVLDVNLGGAYHFCRALARPLMKLRAGGIVNITSVVGQTGNAGQVNYAASKAGLIGFTKSLAKELAPRSITVNAVAPGFIQTDMTDDLGDDVKAGLLASIPLGTLGEVEDIAAAVLFLLGSGGRYITGQVISVNGGMAM